MIDGRVMYSRGRYDAWVETPTFGEYAQVWLNNREAVEGTRDNYKGTLNLYWMPHFATTRIDEIGGADIRRGGGNVLDLARSPAQCPRQDGQRDEVGPDGWVLFDRNPVKAIARPRTQKKVVDPFTRPEAEAVIEHLYKKLTGLTRTYACYFEFAFFTRMRPCDLMALRWEEIDFKGRSAHVCRIVVDGEIKDRVKTKNHRHVLLNDRALHAGH
ncbi:hypothetical protein D3C76_910230 [compost metagenome]